MKLQLLDIRNNPFPKIKKTYIFINKKKKILIKLKVLLIVIKILSIILQIIIIKEIEDTKADPNSLTLTNKFVNKNDLSS